MSKDVIISPIFYMGCKKKLINKGLLDLFPKSINTFVDLFAGSGIISMNVKAKKYFLNDCDNNVFKLYEMFKLYDSDTIIQSINKNINEFGLARERTKRNEFKDKEKIEKYKTAYFNFRNYYNINPNPLNLYTLMFYSFSQQMRFNNKGEFNMPCGNDCFSKNNEIYIKNGCKFFSQNTVNISNNDFRKLNILKLSNSDFVYLDPPYFNTTATYNENNGWKIKDENDLYAMCKKLNENNIKWGMSNVFYCKNKENINLIEWCNKNNWNVYTFDKFSYMACGKGNSNAQEVYICNY